MVNVENMQKWIDALRSGEYHQTTGYLELPSGNCAEGVACREAIKAGVDVEVYETRQGCTAFDGAFLGMPESVRRWLGCDPDRPIWAHDRWSVSYVNDAGWSFDQIADGLYAQYVKEPKTDG